MSLRLSASIAKFGGDNAEITLLLSACPQPRQHSKLASAYSAGEDPVQVCKVCPHYAACATASTREPGIPAELFEEAYLINGSLQCVEINCTTNCEPDVSPYGETLTLLPGELAFLAERGIQHDTSPYGEFIGGRKYVTRSCSYFTEVGGCVRCKTYSTRPIDCRLYPLCPDLEGDKLQYYVSLNCPQARNASPQYRAAVEAHCKAWIAWFDKALPYIPAWWWALFSAEIVSRRVVQDYAEVTWEAWLARDFSEVTTSGEWVHNKPEDFLPGSSTTLPLRIEQGSDD